MSTPAPTASPDLLPAPLHGLTPFVPWIVIGTSIAVGIMLSVGCSWGAYFAERRQWRGTSLLRALRGAIVLYALAAGLTFAPFDFSHQPKRELQVDRTIVALIIIATTIVLSRMAVTFVHALGRRHGDRFPASSLFANVAQILVMLVGALILLQSLNIAIAPILTALGVGGLAVALALQDTLANLFAGIQIIAAHQLRPGDYIALDSGADGYVVDINWRNTTIRPLGKTTIIVPNAKLAQSVLTNFSGPETTIVSVDVPVAYGQDLSVLAKDAVDIARSVARDLGAPGVEPYVRFREFTDTGVTATAYFAVGRTADPFAAVSLFNERLFARTSAKGVFTPLKAANSSQEGAPPTLGSGAKTSSA